MKKSLKCMSSLVEHQLVDLETPGFKLQGNEVLMKHSNLLLSHVIEVRYLSVTFDKCFYQEMWFGLLTAITYLKYC